MDSMFIKRVRSLMTAGKIQSGMSVLVVCGEEMDAEMFDDLQFKNVTVSNLDTRHEGSWATGATWAHKNAEQLDYADASFDIVAVHSGLHHCRYPHKALCEMYRVARVAVLVSEPSKCWLTDLGRRLGFGQDYEVHAVAAHHLKSGGVNNAEIPNYVYRWSARELEDTIKSYAPEYRHAVTTLTHLEVHWHDLRAKKNPVRLLLMLCIYPFLNISVKLFPRMGNILFAYIPVASEEQLHPWLEHAGNRIVPNKRWFAERMRIGG